VAVIKADIMPPNIWKPSREYFGERERSPCPRLMRLRIAALVLFVLVSTAVATVLAQAETVTAVPGATVTVGGCAAVYNQSGVFVCLPTMPEVRTDFGSVVVNAHNNTYIELTVMLFSVNGTGVCSVDVQLLDGNGTLLYEYSNSSMRAGDSVAVGVSLPQPVDYVVVNATLCGVQIPLYAVLTPKTAFKSPPLSDPLFMFLLALLPAAPAIGLLMRGEAALGGVATLAALPAIYILALYVAPDPAKIPSIIVATLIAALLLAVAGRRS